MLSALKEAPRKAVGAKQVLPGPLAPLGPRERAVG